MGEGSTADKRGGEAPGYADENEAEYVIERGRALGASSSTGGRRGRRRRHCFESGRVLEL